jgi:MYXO-CTERM domain-containing protein
MAKPHAFVLSIVMIAASAVVSSSANAAAPAAVPGNRVADFCKAAPAMTVVRAKLHADSDMAHVVEVECVYGPPTPTEHLSQRFFGTPEDETLLVSLEKDGNVVGTAWPVFKEKVSLEFGIPDMSEAEAVSLLQSPQCQEQLRALRDRGIRPSTSTIVSTAPPGRGCAHCAAGGKASASDVFSVVVLAVAISAVIRRRRPSLGVSGAEPLTMTTSWSEAERRRLSLGVSGAEPLTMTSSRLNGRPPFF